jgi:predicted GNAT family N-acyltransferase
MALHLSAFEHPGEIESCWAIRREVFVIGQQVTEDEEIDGRDPECVHFLAKLDGEPVGAARMRRSAEGVAKAERVAVLLRARGAGVGTALMRALERYASQKGYREILLGAQVSALPFYEKLGYIVEGDEFLDARIPHRRMRRRLP